MADVTGTVSNREDKLVLTVPARTARAQFGKLVDLLNANKVDLVEVTNHGSVVCVMTTPSPAPLRLPEGEFKIE
ncbi:MAG TPA: hypothetical protein VMU27_01130 [Candidatus Paceibacterota bacterium]|nr:hypothetical protein [Candidatus Paceibacterota bacterium]